MKWIRENLPILSLGLSVIAILVSVFSIIHSSKVDERTRKLEVYNHLKKISSNLNLRITGDSLSYDTRQPEPNETVKQRESRLREAGLGIEALSLFADDTEKEESMIFFLRAVWLLQLREYEKLDKLFQESVEEHHQYDQVAFLSIVTETEYREGRIKEPEQIFEKLLSKKPDSIFGNLSYALVLKNKGKYKLALQRLKIIEPILSQDSSYRALVRELKEHNKSSLGAANGQ